MKLLRSIVVVLVSLAAANGYAQQQSDYEVKERFKATYDAIRVDIDSARTAEQVAQIPHRIESLESEYSHHGRLISGAFYPKTFNDMLADLRDRYAFAKEKAMLIQTQGTRIIELEGIMVTLNAELEQLYTERKELLAKLKSTETSLAEQRELVSRLNQNLAANDKLVNAMIDSIFLPFGRNIETLSAAEKDALGKKLEKADIVNRIAGIAQDNVAFLSSTRLEAKDYGVLVSQYYQFKNRWDGLRDKVTAALAARNAITKSKMQGKKAAEAAAAESEELAQQVDATIATWRSKLESSFWTSLAAEFSNRGVSVQQFNDPKSFSASIRSYVETAKANGADTRVFVDEIWIQRIDKDWKAALENESMLGKVEYASLDKTVSQLHKEKFNWQIVFWVFNVIAVVVVGWWILTRKPKKSPEQQPVAAKTNI